MKKSTKTFIILFALCALVFIMAAHSANAQTLAKKDTVKKPKYEYFVVIPVSDYQQIFGALTEYKSLQMYNPNSDDKAKVQLFKTVEAYLKELPTRIKLDSVLIKR